VQVVGTYSPPLGFEKSNAENAKILKKIAAANPDILIVGLGAPKQELWVHKHRELLRAKAALCVGATIDFLAGEKKRAPRWVQAAKCEWLYRMLSEPRRLGKRYAHDAIVFPRILARELITG
jgi:N-acetylglucosaminyldiphosphoundecaprenol N-acetyl-beta-D-mannosaminyltransferase